MKYPLRTTKTHWQAAATNCTPCLWRRHTPEEENKANHSRSQWKKFSRWLERRVLGVDINFCKRRFGSKVRKPRSWRGQGFYKTSKAQFSPNWVFTNPVSSVIQTCLKQFFLGGKTPFWAVIT